jgi:inosine-uridine nucleoside N-ribohydrolase
MKMVKDIIIDTDIGDDIDDAFALAFALNSSELNLKAVTTVFGNVEVRTKLALKLLKTFGRDDIPVATGVGKPFFERTYRRDRYLGDEVPRQAVVLVKDEPLSKPYPMHTVDLIISTVMDAKNEVTIIPIGALTNIATCIIKEPKLVESSKLVIMGGAVSNWFRLSLSRAEHNIRCDPEAARIVFESGIPITMVGLDVTMKCILSEEQVESLRKRGLATTNLLSNMTEGWGGKRVILHDPLAVAVSFDPTLTKTQPRLVNVVTTGKARGFTLASENENPNTQVCIDVDFNRFVSIFMKRILKKPN